MWSVCGRVILLKTPIQNAHGDLVSSHVVLLDLVIEWQHPRSEAAFWGAGQVHDGVIQNTEDNSSKI